MMRRPSRQDSGHRSLSLLASVFAICALTALVAVIAATSTTVLSTTIAEDQDQEQSLHADAVVYDTLIGYAATHRSWTEAAGLVDRLAARNGHAVDVTDALGRTLVGSPGSTRLHDVAKARATLDPLAADVALTSNALPTRPSETTLLSRSVHAVPCVSVGGCRSAVVAPSTLVDRRVLATASPARRSALLTAVRRASDRCLSRTDLGPVIAVTTDFGALVASSEPSGTVAICVRTAVRTVLAPVVAPPALLFIDGGRAPARVFWDFSPLGRLRIAGVAAAVLLVTLLLSFLLARRVAAPLRLLAVAARRAGDGDLTARVPQLRSGEVGELAAAFNRMADRREQSEDARTRLISEVSHELRTPLSNLRGWLEAAQDGLAQTDERLLASLLEETVHLQDLVDDLHQLAIGDAGELRLHHETIDLPVFLNQISEAFAKASAEARVRLSVAAAPRSTVVGDPKRLRQAVVNLVANSIRHTPPDGSVTLVGTADRIEVTDTGEGIPASEVPLVFDRFRRADPSRSRATGGSGLGLPIVRQLIEAHGGTVTLSSTLGVGTSVLVQLPRRRRLPTKSE